MGARVSVNGYPVRGPALWRVGGYQPLFVWDFTQQSPGALVLPTGLTFARASSGHTVQDGVAALITTGITSNDVGRIGRLSSAHSYGLFVEPARTNLVVQARRPDLLPNGSFASTSGGQSDPLGGTAAYRCQTLSGSLGRFYATAGAVTGSYSGSYWVRQGAGSGVYQLVAGNTNRALAAGTAAATWARVSATHSFPTETAYYLPLDGRDFSAVGGLTAGDRDAVLDLLQFELGKYPSSAIVTSGGTATRAAERLTIDSTRTAASLVSGRLGVYLRFRALSARSELGAADGQILSDSDAGLSYGVWVDSAGVVKSEVSGTVASESAAAALTWARGDLVEIATEIGAGKALFRWRVNGGAVTTVSFEVVDSTHGAITPPAGIDVLCAGTSWVTPGILEVVGTFVPRRGPF
jgi:hypothetical protein